MSCTVSSGTLVGVDAHPVRVEVDLLRRLPAVVIVGLPGGAVRESADRVRSALQQASFEFPRKRVVVNLAPADLRKSGTGFDLPIAVGILAASEQVPLPRLTDTAFFGELSLDGQLRRVRGCLPVALMARAQGLKRLVVPMEQPPRPPWWPASTFGEPTHWPRWPPGCGTSSRFQSPRPTLRRLSAPLSTWPRFAGSSRRDGRWRWPLPVGTTC